jgi:cytochrome c-type biogenesis protein
MNQNLSLIVTFGAGLLSFLSPCVLPLIPSYLCVIGGTPLSGSGESSGGLRPRLAAATLSFILGFSAVFIILSVIFAATFSLMGSVTRYINIIAGIVVVALGLNVIFDFLSFLNYEKRFHLANRPKGIIGTFVAGAAFGAGWTPCVGPALGSILLLAAQSGGIPKAVLYLAVYSAGLGLPFLLASLFFNTFLKTSAKLRSRMPLIKRISGALLVFIGVLMIGGQYQALNALAVQWQNKLSNNGAVSGGGTAAEKVSANDANNAAADSGAVPSAGAASGSKALPSANAISPEVTRALNAAGLPAVAEGIDPIDFELPLLAGTRQRLSDLKGKVVFLNFWATWCGPCRIEMPSMETVYRRLQDRGFTVLAVNIGEQKKEVSAFMKENKLSFPAALDEKGTIAAYYGVQAIPTTYIIDRRGLIVSRMVGSIDWNKPEIIAAFETLLGQ